MGRIQKPGKTSPEYWHGKTVSCGACECEWLFDKSEDKIEWRAPTDDSRQQSDVDSRRESVLPRERYFPFTKCPECGLTVVLDDEYKLS